MGLNELEKPVFWVTREPGGLRINVPVKPQGFRTLLNLVWLLLWAGAEAAIVLFLLGGFGAPASVVAVPLPVVAAFLAVFTVAGGFVLWRWLWRVGGRESFLVARNALLARREIWGIGRSRSFDLEKTRILKTGRLKYRVIYPSRGRMFIGNGESEIVIGGAGRTYAYGKGLEAAEARDLVDLLQEEMGFQFHQPPPQMEETLLGGERP